MTYDDRTIEQIAQRRANAKIGWFLHAGIYFAVNLMLAVLSARSGKGWAAYPALGWGIGLAAHGAAVFVLSGGSGLYQRLVERERARLALQRDPW